MACVGLAAAAAAVVVVVGVGTGGGDTGGTALPADPSSDGPSSEAVQLSADDLAGGALAVLGRRDLGPLADDDLAGCLAANGVPPGTDVLGASPVQLDGADGVLLLLPTGTAGRITALVVGPGCSARDAAELARQDIGGR